MKNTSLSKAWILFLTVFLIASLLVACGATSEKPTEEGTDDPDKNSESTVCEHTSVTDPAVEPTCTETGKTEGSHCEKCGEVLIAREDLPAKGHTAVTDPAVAATCQKAGKTEGSHCSVCDTVLTAQSDVPAKAHTWSDATCQKPQTCTVCKTTTGSKKAHNYKNGKCLDCNAADPDFKSPEDAFRIATVPILNNGYDENGNAEYYVNKDLTVVYRIRDDVILLRYECDVSGYTIFNVCVEIAYGSNDVKVSVVAFKSGSYTSGKPETYLQKTAIKKTTNINYTGYSQLFSQQATLAMKEILPAFDGYLNEYGVSMAEMGFTNYN